MDVTFSMMRYSILSVARWISDYETIGGLLYEAQKDILELTVSLRIWQIICSLLSDLTSYLNIEIDSFLSDYISNNE